MVTDSPAESRKDHRWRISMPGTAFVRAAGRTHPINGGATESVRQESGKLVGASALGRLARTELGVLMIKSRGREMSFIAALICAVAIAVAAPVLASGTVVAIGVQPQHNDPYIG